MTDGGMPRPANTWHSWFAGWSSMTTAEREQFLDDIQRVYDERAVVSGRVGGADLPSTAPTEDDLKWKRIERRRAIAFRFELAFAVLSLGGLFLFLVICAITS